MKTRIKRMTIFSFLAFLMLTITGAAVASGAVVSGAIGNINGYSANIEPDDDISINLRDLMTWQVVHSGRADAIAQYILNNVNLQSFWIELIVADRDGTAYPSYTTGALLNVTMPEVTHDFDLPTMVNAYTLTINVGGDYVPGDEYTYSVVRADDYTEVAGGTTTSGTIQVDLAEGTYRLNILADNYEPYEYALAGDYEIYLDEPLSIDALLTMAAGFKTNPPVAEVTHEATDTGFVLSVVTENFVDAFSMAINNVGTVDPSDISGAGTADDPFQYTWAMTDSPTQVINNEPGAGDVTLRVEFTFNDGATQLPDFVYTVDFIIYASEANAEANKPEDQKELEEEYGDTPTYIILGQKEFLPMKGGVINVKLRDHTGAKRKVAINIPPIPTSLLFIDDYPSANNNLDYTRSTDRYDIPNAPLTKTIAPTDVLKLKVRYYRFRRSLANGVCMKFVVSRGPNKGARVRYNPIPSASVARDYNAPKIVLPMMLNPNSRVFRRFARLSEAKRSLRVLVSERGDGRWFHIEKLPFTVQDDGLMLIQLHHLTTVGVQEAATAASESGGGGGGCFIATAAYGSYFEKHVKMLRQLRDEILLKSDIGRAFVAAYYKTSPPIADFIAEHDSLRTMVRWGLAPVVGLSWVALNHGTFAALAMMLSLLLLLSGSGVILYRQFRK